MSEKNQKILLTDDSMFMRKILRTILEEAGFTDITEAQNGKECMEQVATIKPDLVLLDLIMPEMDGIAVLTELKGATNVVVVSAVGQDQVLEQARDLGAKGYIVKPFEKEQVLEVLTELFGSL